MQGLSLTCGSLSITLGSLDPNKLYYSTARFLCLALTEPVLNLQNEIKSHTLNWSYPIFLKNTVK